METVTAPEQVQPVTLAELGRLKTEQLDEVSAQRVLDHLEVPRDEDLPHYIGKLSELVNKAAETTDWRQIDRTTASLRRLGVVEVDAKFPDPVLDGPELRLKQIAGHPEALTGALAELRRRRPELIKQETGQQLTDRLSVPGHTYTEDDKTARLADLTARMIIDGQLQGKLGQTEFTPAPDTIAKTRLEAVQTLAPKDRAKFWEQVNSAKTAQEHQAHQVKHTAEAEARARETAARQVIESARLTPEQGAALAARDAALDIRLTQAVENRERVLSRQSLDQTSSEESREIARQRLADRGGLRHEELQKVRDEAHAEALQGDRENRAISEVLEWYDQRLKNVKDAGQRAELLRQRNIDAGRVRGVMQEINRTAARVTAESRQYLHQDKDLIQILAKEEFAEEKAAAIRENLGVQTEPFLVVSKGGLLHRKQNRGPRVEERYFRAPDNPHLLIVERRAKKNGELISQTAFTSERPTRDLGHDRILPPKGFNIRMEQVRRHDKISSGYASSMGDYVPSLAGRESLRSDRGGSMPAKKRRPHGSFWFWLLGERV